MFTAVAIAQLRDAQKLQYSDTIAQHLPEFPNREAARKIQIHHLLEHTSGLGDPFDSPKMANSKNYKRQSDWFETFADKPLAFEPGARHEYSNGGYIVLAAIVEKLSGQAFPEYLKEKVFKPAGMRHTGSSTSSENLPVSVPHAITIAEDPLGLKGFQPKASEKQAKDGVGMGGWTSTTRDLFNFARALRTSKLLPTLSVDEITTGKVSVFPPPMDVKYGYGFYEMPMKGDRMVGHSGGGGDLGMGAEVEMLWKSGYTIIVLSNHGLDEARYITHTVARFLASQEQLNSIN
jgi:D-alanyl-D-alanine carboxypeptidase